MLKQGVKNMNWSLGVIFVKNGIDPQKTLRGSASFTDSLIYSKAHI